MLMLNVMRGDIMEQAVMWNLMYVLPTSAILLAIGGVFFAAKLKTRWAAAVAVGTCVEATALLIQRFIPVYSGTLNEAGEVIASSPMSLVRQLSCFMSPLGIMIIAAGLFWGAMSYKAGK